MVSVPVKASGIIFIIMLLTLLTFGLQAQTWAEVEPETASSVHEADNKMFLEAFDAYQRTNYETAIGKFNKLLSEYPDTALRDLVYFWVAQAYLRTGNISEARRYLVKLSKESPDFPLKGQLSDEQQKLLAVNGSEKPPTQITASLPKPATEVKSAIPPRPESVVVAPEPLPRNSQSSTPPEPRQPTGALTVLAVETGPSFIHIRTGGLVKNYTSFRQTEPERLVIDIPGAKSRLSGKAVTVNKWGITRVRTGIHPHAVRVVLDTAAGRFPAYEIHAGGDGVKIIFTDISSIQHVPSDPQ